MPRYQVAVSVYVYFEIEAESQDTIRAMPYEEVEDVFFANGGSKYETVDMRTADFANVAVFDEVEW